MGKLTLMGTVETDVLTVVEIGKDWRRKPYVVILATHDGAAPNEKHRLYLNDDYALVFKVDTV